jgi:type II restriction enzyme
LSEKWFAEEMFCPACSSDELGAFETNYPVADFFCPKCEAKFQLKSQRNRFGYKLNDGAYSKMLDAVRSEAQPHFFLLHYNPVNWNVLDLLVVPRFFFTESVIEKRSPLSASAQRAGWVGCNILLSGIPVDGRISVVEDSQPFEPEAVRSSWKRVAFLGEEKVSERSWLVDVMSCVRQLGRTEFTLSDVYSFEDHLQRLHPKNQNIEPKIRQQLQFLRDKGYLKFLGSGKYQLRR